MLSVAFLGRRLTAAQWLAVVLLTAGVVAVELSDASAAASSPGSAAGLSLRSLGRQGVGALAVQSVRNLDRPVIIGVVLMGGFFIVIINIIVDLLYAVLDPRVRGA